MLRPRSSPAADGIPDTLPVLPIGPPHVLLPAGVMSIQIQRKENIQLLQSVLTDAERSRTSAILAITPIQLAALAKSAADKGNPSHDEDTGSPESDAGASDDDKAGHSKSKTSLQIVRLPAHLATSTPDDSFVPSVRDLSEWACAARVLRIEKMSSTVTINNETTTTHSGYVLIVEGLTRIHLDRFTSVGRPFFEAQVTSYPRTGAPVDAEMADKLLDVANKCIEILGAPASSGTSRTPLPAVPAALSAIAVKRLRSQLRNYSAETADETSDILMTSLLPSSRAASYPAKLQHLSLNSTKERVEHAISQLEILKTELDSREAIGVRYAQNMNKRTKEAVLRGLLEAIHQELRALHKSGQDDDSDDGPGSIRIMGGPRQSGGDADADVEEDEMVAIERKINESSMPEDARKIVTREFKRLKNISPMSAEHSVISNYLDWMTSLPWEKSTYETAEAVRAMESDFLVKARQQLDDDHFGIDKVKDRLLQYLAVIRLRNEAWEAKEQKRLAEVAAEEEAQRKIDEAAAATESNAVVSKDSTAKRGKKSAKAAVKPKAIAASPRNRSPKSKAPILLLLGPPGVGKTSIAKSLATALGRPYTRIALGGVHDEAEIRGFKRTYVGAMPGNFVQALRRVGVNDPVILLDEIDKLSSGAQIRGDPSAAMLEVLDPEQNHSFTDHYINTPIDLSSVTFIASANDISTIPAPLRDRMEVIRLSGYVDVEKMQIGKRFLLPKQVDANQLQPGHVSISDDVLMHLIHRYAQWESGVRTLERQIGAVVRSKAVELITVRDKLSDRPSLDAIDIPGYNPVVTQDDLATILGANYHEEEELDSLESVRPGTATGLAYMGSGNGGVLTVEVTSFPGSGRLRMTGSLGKVILESAEIALSWIKANAYELGLTADKKEDLTKGLNLHVHMPAGSIPKDGPSAGVAFVLAMVSLFSGLTIDPRLAMTGEVSLRGKVTAIGGVKEKVLGAHRAGVKRVMLPLRNRKDAVADLPARIKEEVQIEYVENVWQALEIAFGDRLLHLYRDAPSQRPSQFVSRL